MPRYDAYRFGEHPKQKGGLWQKYFLKLPCEMLSGDWRREELRRSEHKKDEAKIKKVYSSPTSNSYYEYDETDCGPDSLSDSYWGYHGYD